MSNNDLMSINEAAAFLDVHRITLHRWTREGKFTVTRIGRKSFLSARDIQAFKVNMEAVECKKATELISVAKAANYLAVHFTTLYRWIKSNKLQPVKIGWQVYLSIEQVETIKARLDSQMKNTTSHNSS